MIEMQVEPAAEVALRCFGVLFAVDLALARREPGPPGAPLTVLVIDASVWVSAADATDAFSEASRAFLVDVAERAESVVLPDFAELEVACALARRLRDPERGRQLAGAVLRSPFVAVRSLGSSLLRLAITTGTEKLLRAGDAVYAAVSEAMEGEVVSWDEALIQRAGAVTPRQWMEQNAAVPEDEEDRQVDDPSPRGGPIESPRP